MVLIPTPATPPTWNSDESELRLNPRMPPALAARALDAIEQVEEGAGIRGLLWMSTSGTTRDGGLELIGLSRAAFLASAASVNRHLEATDTDVWMAPLPLFHVGGLSVHARAHLSGSRVVAGWEPTMRWTAADFGQRLEKDGVTLTAVVPTQLHDLVRAGFRAPDALRVMLVGGDALSPALYRAAVERGWPVLPTYGMTEACSQVATAQMGRVGDEPPPLMLLDHVQARTNDEGHLEISGPSLLTATVRVPNIGGPRILRHAAGEWLATQDRVELQPGEGGTVLRPRGRSGDMIKIGGEGSDLARLRATLSAAVIELKAEGEHELLAIPDDRLGHEVHLVTTDEGSAAKVRERFDAAVLPYERVREIHSLKALPRTPLGKLRRGALEAAIVARRLRDAR